MLLLACVLAVVGVVSFVAGFVFFANGAGVAPHRRTPDDPTGIKRATKRVEWPDVFRGMRRCVSRLLNEESPRSDRLRAAGSFLVLIGLVATFIAILAFLAALL